MCKSPNQAQILRRIEEAVEFEHAMAQVSALTSHTAEQYAQLTSEARELSVIMQCTRIGSAQLIGLFALAGFDVNKILEILTAMKPPSQRPVSTGLS